VTGSPSGGAALKVIRAIEDAGAVVVAFENCSGLKSMLLTDEENPDVYDALARRYLGIGCSCMSPNPNRMAMLDKLIDEFHVDGVVDIILQACHTYNVETALVGKLVKEKKGIPYTQTTDLESVIPQLDILYMTRVQKERFFNEEDYLRLKDSYILTPEKLENAKADLSILHPLPRVNEITVAVDKDPRAAYWRQVKNGKYIRMALILKLLGIQV